MDFPAQPSNENLDADNFLTKEELIKQLELAGVHLGDDPGERIDTFVNAGILPLPQVGRFPTWTAQRVIAIENRLATGESLAEIQKEVQKERRQFLSGVKDLNSLVNLYKKFQKNSAFFLFSFLLLFLLSMGVVASSIVAPGNPVAVAGEYTVKAALDSAGKIAKTAAAPVGKTLVVFIQASKPQDSNSADPLQLTNMKNAVALDALDNLIIAGDVQAKSFAGLGEDLTNLPASEVVGELTLASLPWSSVTSQPTVVSAIDSISNDEGNIDLVAGTGISILSDNSLDKITISSTNLGSSQAVFKNIAAAGQSAVTADINNDTLTLIAGANLVITTDPTADSVTFSVTGTIANADTLDLLDSSQFLRSDVGDSLTAGTLTLEAGTTLSVLGTFTCTNCIGDAAVVDTITASNYLPLAGGTMAGNINLNNNLLLNIGNAATDFTVGGGLSLATSLSVGMALADDTDYVYFDTGTSEYLAWTDALGKFDLSNDLDVAGNGAFGSGAAINASRTLNLVNTIAPSAPNYCGLAAMCSGIYMETTFSPAGDSFIGGLGIYNVATFNSAFAFFQLVGLYTNVGTSAGSAVIPFAYGIDIGQSFQVAPNTVYGLHIQDFGATGTTDVYSFYIEDITAGANRYPIYQAGSSGQNIFLAGTSMFGRVPSGNDTSFRTVIQGSLCVDDSTANCPAGPTAGAIYVENSVGAGNVSAFDISEYYPATSPTEKGDIVAAAGNSSVKRSAKAYDPGIIGIVSSDPAVVIDETNITFGKTAGERFNPLKPYIALAGRVPTKVSTENGDIEPGDPLTSSSTPGVAMKATSSGPIIGKALEAYSGSGIGKIMVFVSVGWFVQPVTSDQSPVTSNLTSIDVQTLTAGTMNTQVLFIGNRKISMAKNGALKIEGNVEITGELTAKKLNVSAEASGSFVLPAGSSRVFVAASAISARSQVSVTPNTLTERILTVTKKEAGKGFTVEIISPETNDITFDWFIIN